LRYAPPPATVFRPSGTPCCLSLFRGLRYAPPPATVFRPSGTPRCLSLFRGLRYAPPPATVFRPSGTPRCLSLFRGLRYAPPPATVFRPSGTPCCLSLFRGLRYAPPGYCLPSLRDSVLFVAVPGVALRSTRLLSSVPPGLRVVSRCSGGCAHAPPPATVFRPSGTQRHDLKSLTHVVTNRQRKDRRTVDPDGSLARH